MIFLILRLGQEIYDFIDFSFSQLISFDMICIKFRLLVISKSGHLVNVIFKISLPKLNSVLIIGTSTPMNEKDVYQQCDLKFILMGKDHYVQLIKKPSVAMPILPLQPMESVYESGYYEDVTPVENITDTNTIVTLPPLEQPSQNNDLPSMNSDTTQYCAVHGCEVTLTAKDRQSEIPTLSEQDTVNFPIAAKVCETTSNSSLHEFNPLIDSEPNLEFDMTDQDNEDNPDLHVKLIQDAKTRKWQVKIRNLTKEQLDLIAGPRLFTNPSENRCCSY